MRAQVSAHQHCTVTVSRHHGRKLCKVYRRHHRTSFPGSEKTKKKHLSTSKRTSTQHCHFSLQNTPTPTRPLRTVASETDWIQSWRSRPGARLCRRSRAGFCAHFTEREICLNLASTGWSWGPSHSKSDSWRNSCFLIPSKPTKIPVSMPHQKHHISLWRHSSAQWFLVPAGLLNKQFLEVFSLVINCCSKLNRTFKNDIKTEPIHLLVP